MKTRDLTWKGRVAARALYFAHNVDDVAQRAIAHWRPGARMFAFEGGVLVVLARDVYVDARTADGEVFVDVDGVLSSLPLRKTERETFARGSVVYARGGELERTAIASLPIVDVATLIDTDAFDIVEVEPLAPPAPPAPPPAPPRFDARAALLGDTTPNPERDAAARAFREGRAVVPAAPASSSRRAGAPVEPGTPVDPRELVDGAGRPVPDTALRRAQMRAAQGLPTEGAGDAMMRALASALEAVGVLDRLRRMQRDYVEDTLERLKRGELDDALRRAIPLGRPGDFARPRPPSLAMPTPRASLNLTGQRTAAPASSIALEDDLVTRLRNSYRDAAKKLEKAGRFREAAFVYVELLGEIHEAIALLERAATTKPAPPNAAELFELAAQLAESWELPAGVVVRQWLLAGNVERAYELARRRRAFADGIAALERSSHHEHARMLRIHWSRQLANAGAYAAAVDALAPLPNSPDLAAAIDRLLDDGINAGGVDLPRLVARRLLSDSAKNANEPPRDLPRMRAMIDDDSADGPARRTQLAYALGTTPSLRPAASFLVRALYADVAAGRTNASLKLLSERLADPVLRADLPATFPPPVARHPTQIVVLDGPPGHSVARAVALLPEGRLLVGLGEAGAFVSTRKGGAAWRTTEPCDEIVLADSGDRAVLVARRGTFLRLARARIASGVVRHLVDMRADHVAHTTDGDLLFLARDLDLIGLDILDDESNAPKTSSSPPRILWQSRLRGPVFALARDEQGIAALHDDPDGLRLTVVDARTLAPREVRPIPDGIEVLPLLEMSAAGEIVGCAPAGALAVVPPDAFGLQPPMGALIAAPLAVSRNIAALGYVFPDASAGVVVRARPHQRLVIQLRDAAPTALFVRDTTLVVCDDRGRAFVVDAVTGAIAQTIALP